MVKVVWTYYMFDMVHTAFTMGVDVPEIGHKMDVSIMIVDICTCCVFTLLCMAEVKRHLPYKQLKDWLCYITTEVWLK